MLVYWWKAQREIALKLFAPYLLYLGSSITFFSLTMKSLNQRYSASDKVAIQVLGPITLLAWAYNLGAEITQFYSQEKKLNYFKSFWNYVDMFTLITVPVLVVTSWSEYPNPRPAMINLAAFTTFAHISKVFEWLKLFE